MVFKSEGALKSAILLEEEGRVFYLKAVAEVKSLTARMVFEQLAREEELHIVAVKRIYASLEESSLFNEWVTTTGSSVAAAQVFETESIDIAREAEDDIAALKLALDLEAKSVKYYDTLLDGTEDPFERRFYMTLSFEERGHYLRILDSIKYLADPADWHDRREKEAAGNR